MNLVFYMQFNLNRLINIFKIIKYLHYLICIFKKTKRRCYKRLLVLLNFAILNFAN